MFRDETTEHDSSSSKNRKTQKQQKKTDNSKKLLKKNLTCRLYRQCVHSKIIRTFEFNFIFTGFETNITVIIFLLTDCSFLLTYSTTLNLYRHEQSLTITFQSSSAAEGINKQ